MDESYEERDARYQAALASTRARAALLICRSCNSSRLVPTFDEREYTCEDCGAAREQSDG